MPDVTIINFRTPIKFFTDVVPKKDWYEVLRIISEGYMAFIEFKDNQVYISYQKEIKSTQSIKEDKNE